MIPKIIQYNLLGVQFKIQTLERKGRRQQTQMGFYAFLKSLDQTPEEKLFVKCLKERCHPASIIPFSEELRDRYDMDQLKIFYEKALFD